MPSVKLSPLYNDQTFIPGTNTPASGYKLFVYAAGSSTKQASYTDNTGTVQQANPIVLNSSGQPANPIWLAVGQTYKFVLAAPTDTDPPAAPLKTIDNVSGVNDASISTNQWQSSGVTPTYVSTTSFTLPGDQTTEFHVGRRAQFTVTAGTVYGTIKTTSYAASLTTVTMVMDGSSVLDSGLSAVNLSILRADVTAVPFTNAYVYIRDEKASGTDGGASLAGTQARVLNTKVSDTLGIATLSSNQIVLAAGTYRVAARAPAFACGRHKIRLRVVSGAGQTLIVGSNAYTATTDVTQTDSVLRGRFTIAASQVLELQHYTENAIAGNGLGVKTTTGESEVYAEIEFWKEA